jgi:hypothetical protein
MSGEQDAAGSSARPSARADLYGGLGWVALGAAIVIASWRMDRLESQHINPYSAPGLVPGVLGVLMALFGGTLALRALVGKAPQMTAVALDRAGVLRTILAATLCIAFAAGLLGHGLPFVATAAAFIFSFVLAFAERRRIIRAAAIAVIAAMLIAYLFGDIFLVRLP